MKMDVEQKDFFKIPFSENVYRVGSDKYFKVIKEARKAYKLGEIKPMNEEDHDLFNNSHLGEWAMFEGERVPLDFPMYIETLDEKKKKKSRNEVIGHQRPVTPVTHHHLQGNDPRDQDSKKERTR